MTTQAMFWAAAGLAAATAVAAGLADWRRANHRRDLDNLGWVPWRGIQAAAMFAVVLLAILALKS